MSDDPQKMIPIDVPAETPTFSPEALDALMAKVSVKASSGQMAPPEMRRRRASIVIPPDICEPGIFTAPFKLTIEGLSSKDERGVIDKTDNGQSLAWGLARRSMRLFNGVAMTPTQADIVWDALGFAGRTALVNAWLEHCSGVSKEGTLGGALAVTLE